MARPPVIGPQTWLDFSILVLALDCGKALVPDDPVVSHGVTLLRRYMGDLTEGTRMVVDPIMERDDAGVLKSLYRLVQNHPQQ